MSHIIWHKSAGKTRPVGWLYIIILNFILAWYYYVRIIYIFFHFRLQTYIIVLLLHRVRDRFARGCYIRQRNKNVYKIIIIESPEKLRVDEYHYIIFYYYYNIVGCEGFIDRNLCRRLVRSKKYYTIYTLV